MRAVADDNTVYRAIKYRVYPTDAQSEKLSQTFGCARKVYNDALSMQRGLYEAGMPTFGQTALNAYCNRVWKDESPFLTEVDKFALTNSLYALCAAYKNFFEGRTGYPLLWSSFFVTLVAKKIVLINLCCRPCFIWGSITIITVWTNMIIINVCKFFYLLIECFLCCKLIQICAFILQGIEITLHRCIVVRISCFAHALCHIYRFAEFGKCFGRIL